jgi:hypothetical protein
MTPVHRIQWQILDGLGHLGGELLEQSLVKDRHAIEDKRYLAITAKQKNKLEDISQDIRKATPRNLQLMMQKKAARNVGTDDAAYSN